MNKLSEMSHLDKLIIYCLGNLNSLVDKKLVIPGCIQITPSGLEIFEELKKIDFKPEKKEVEEILTQLQYLCLNESLNEED